MGRRLAGMLQIMPACHASRCKSCREGIAPGFCYHVSQRLTTVGGAAHMPQLAEEDAPSLTHGLCDWLPCLYLLWCVNSWNIWIPMALLQSIMTGWKASTGHWHALIKYAHCSAALNVGQSSGSKCMRGAGQSYQLNAAEGYTGCCPLAKHPDTLCRPPSSCTIQACTTWVQVASVIRSPPSEVLCV